MVIGAVLILGVVSAAPAMAKLEVKTRDAVAISPTSVSLRGEVNTQKPEAAVYVFQYGPTAEYGFETVLGELPAGPIFWQYVSSAAKDLEPGIRYHFRLAAFTDKEGLVLGKDSTFETPPWYVADSPGTLLGQQEVSHGFRLTLQNKLTVTCESVSFAGNTPYQGNTMTLNPTFSKCTAFGLGSTVTANGCQYAFKAGLASEAGKYQGGMELSCPAGKSLEVTTLSCGLTISGGQTGTVVNENILKSGFDAVRATPSMGVTYNVYKDGIGCPMTGIGTFSDGTLSGAVIVQSKDNNGALQGFRVSAEI
jgi:hypothetical protein